MTLQSFQSARTEYRGGSSSLPVAWWIKASVLLPSSIIWKPFDAAPSASCCTLRPYVLHWLVRNPPFLLRLLFQDWCKFDECPGVMPQSKFIPLPTLLSLALPLSTLTYAQSPDVETTSPGSGSQSLIAATSPTTLPSLTGSAVATIDGTTSTFRPFFTVPPAADLGAALIPNINDPQAVDAQTVCPGYIAANLLKSPYGLSASLTLAGDPCNVYGTDIETLNLTVEYQ